ncbi:hypothetical protein [Xanthobacter flavus]|uniref:hypothetical protein n=1 Tax=Xanthobacter flavus TaxID=281 RepID=UPI00372A5DCD
MTVIAYRAGVMAADRAVTSTNGMLAGGVAKITRTSAGWLVGASGHLSAMAGVREWAEALLHMGDEFVPPRGNLTDMDAIFVSPTGRVHYFDGHGFPVEVTGEYFAVGGGESYAMGAMAVGADAIQAVQAACMLGAGLGGGIDVVRLTGA